MDDLDDTDFVAFDHDKLVSAISKLDKTQHITEPTRNEPTNLNSEFNLIKRSNKLDLNKVVRVLGDTAGHVEITNKLKRNQKSSRVLPKPLEKPQVERIKRATGYAATKKKVGRWDPVVARNKTSDYVSFPLKHTSLKLQSTNEFLSKLKTKSDLERELEEIDPPVKEDIEEDDDQQKYPMSYEDMVEHRKNLAKLRAQESYRAAKAKRQSKIKSKKYHRILKKERLKKQLKEFEELQKTDPEEALKKLETLEKARALERHTLRHKNTGKWAKNKLIRAKYDTEARLEIAEQLAVSRSLTQKTQDVDSSDDESIENIPDILNKDPMNPWVLQGKKSNVDSEFEFGYRKYLKNKMFISKDDSDSDEKLSDNDQKQQEPQKHFYGKIKGIINEISKRNNADNTSSSIDEPELKNDTINNMIEAKHVQCIDDKDVQFKIRQNVSLKRSKLSKEKKVKMNKVVATSLWTVETITEKGDEENFSKISSAFENLENKMAIRVQKKINNLKKGIKNLEKLTKDKDKNKKSSGTKESSNNIEYLKLRNKKVKAIIDEELIETSSKTIPVNDSQTENSSSYETKATEQSVIPMPVDSVIELNRITGGKPKYLNTALPKNINEVDELDDNEQVVPNVSMDEVFEEDDVVASFRQEKEDEISKNNPEEIKLDGLPGWGTWGGIGVKVPKRKKNRFITKHAVKTPRRDANKGDIIITEYRDPKLTAHKVKEIPYPFQSLKEYEASIRAPLGNTFIPEKAHKILIKPNVFTKAGAIIEPMDEDELLLKKNRSLKNDSIIKIISKE